MTIYQFRKASLLAFLAFFMCSSFSLPSWGFQTLGESGEIVKSGTYRLGFETQFSTGNNMTAYGDAPLSDSSSLRVHAGAGEVDFYAGASYKWMPYPDFNNQPAMGLKTGVTIGGESNENFFLYHISPLISKKWELENGTLIPYAGFPISFTTFKSRTFTSYQLTLGTEFVTPSVENWTFGAEFSSSIKDSNSYSALYVSINLDDHKPAKKSSSKE